MSGRLKGAGDRSKQNGEPVRTVDGYDHKGEIDHLFFAEMLADAFVDFIERGPRKCVLQFPFRPARPVRVR